MSRIRFEYFSIICVIVLIGFLLIKKYWSVLDLVIQTNTQKISNIDTKSPYTDKTPGENIQLSSDVIKFKQEFLRGFRDVKAINRLGRSDQTNAEGAELYTAVFEDDPVFIALPKYINDKAKLPVVIYSHGQLEYLNKLSIRYANKLMQWASIFTSHGYIFIVPEFYGDNWGNQKALILLKKYHSYLNGSSLVDVQGSYYIAFSMGGRLIYNYLLSDKYLNSRFNKAVILAGSVRANSIPQKACNNLKGVDLIIYHGEKDINVPLTMSINFKNKCKEIPTVKLFKLNGTDHWQLGYTTDWRILEGAYNPDDSDKTGL